VHERQGVYDNTLIELGDNGPSHTVASAFQHVLNLLCVEIPVRHHQVVW
jgi:hypothetical protein